MMQLVRSLLIFIAFCLFVACEGKKAEKPEQLPFDEPIQEKASFVAAPIIFPERDIEQKVNQKLRGRIAIIRNKTVMIKGGKYQLIIDNLSVTKIENIKLHVVGNNLYTTLPVKIDFRGTFKKRISKRKNKYLKLKTQTLKLAVRMRFKTILNVASNWKLHTKTTFTGYDWIQEPTTKLFIGDVKLTQIADKALHKNKLVIEQAIDKAARKAVNLKKPIRKIWVSLQKPIRISKKTPMIWVRPIPQTLAIGSIKGDQGYIRLNTKIGLKVETIIGKEPKYTPSDQLPTIKTKQRILPECDVNVVSKLSYEEINHLANKLLKGKKFDVAGEKIKIKKATISGNGQQLVIQLKVRGGFRGIIYLKGTPRYDLKNRAIKIINLGFDVNSEEVLLNAAGWLLETDTFKDILTEQLVFPLGEKLDQIPHLVDRALAKSKLNDKVDLGLDSLRIRPQKVAVRPDNLEVLINAKAHINIKLKKL